MLKSDAQEVQTKVERVRSLVRSRTTDAQTSSGGNHSPAEDLFSFLGIVSQTVKLVESEANGDQVARQLSDVIKLLEE